MPGGVVRWPADPGSPLGVVVGTDGDCAEVRLGGVSEVRIFNARSAGIERAYMQGIIRRLSTGTIGSVQAQATAAPPRWQILINHRIIPVAEAGLRLHMPDDPKGRILAGRLGTARQLALAVTAQRYEIEQMTSDLVALSESRVVVKPHQVSVALRPRGGAGRCILTAPANLLRQWQFERKPIFKSSGWTSSLTAHMSSTWFLDTPPSISWPVTRRRRDTRDRPRLSGLRHGQAPAKGWLIVHSSAQIEALIDKVLA